MSAASAGVPAYVEATVKCAAQCDDMLACEQEKRRALLEGNTDALERVLQRQQAALMALDTLERKRIATQEAAGFRPSASAREILAKLPRGPEYDALGAAVNRLRVTADELREMNRTALEIAEKELQFQAILDGGPRNAAISPTYKPGHNADGARSASPSFEQEM